MSYQEKIYEYERRKKALEQAGLSSKQYEAAIAKLADELQI